MRGSRAAEGFFGGIFQQAPVAEYQGDSQAGLPIRELGCDCLSVKCRPCRDNRSTVSQHVCPWGVLVSRLRCHASGVTDLLTPEGVPKGGHLCESTMTGGVSLFWYFWRVVRPADS